MHRPLAWIYRELIYNQRREVPFWMLLGFVPTFVAARILVYSQPRLFLHIHGTHVHHFTYGIFILGIIGYIGLVWPGRYRRTLGIVYGIGLALAADEFGMWLRLTDEYRMRGSYDAVIVIGAFLMGVIYLLDLFRAIQKRISHRRT
jgi:hypothetical protein